MSEQNAPERKTDKPAKPPRPTLYALSPDPALTDDRTTRYFPFLNAAFDDIRMRNIAVFRGTYAVAKKIDRTVVFEDMDRLDPKDCVEIFTRPRESTSLPTHGCYIAGGGISGSCAW